MFRYQTGGIGLSSVIKLLLLLFLLQLGSALSPSLHGWQGLLNYLPLHTAMEVGAIVISALVFAVGWSVYQKEGSGNLMLLACCFLGVALLDFMHTLSYAGMPDWVTASGPEKAIDFWLAARALAALALFSVAFLPDRLLTKRQSRWWMLISVLVVVGLINWIVLWHQNWLPRTFLEGRGLTPFKKNAEYLLFTAYAVMAVRLFRKTRDPKVYDGVCLFGASATMAMSEVFFTLYADVADIYNLLGHIYKVIAYGMIYRSVFINSVELPYQRLYQVNRALRASEAKFQAIINESPIAYLLYDDQQRISFLNPAFINTFGFTMADLPNWSDWWLKAFPDPEYRQACLSHWRRHLQRVGQNKLSLAPMELDVCGKDGRKHTILINIAFLGDAFASQQVILLQDITERVETMQLIWRQSYLDPLTELPNRNQFLDKLAQAMNQARKLDQRLALLFIDLDRFKDVNDALGHVSGDILLREAGKRLREAVGDSQPSPARLGGDEFTVIIGDLENHPGVDAIAQAILQSLARPFDLGDETVYLSASIGIAFYPDDADKSAELLKKADQAMFEAKKQGRDRYSFFTPEMQRIAQNRMRLLNELHGALAKQQFMVYYQPIVEFPSGKICKAEALLRWRHPDLGMISPAEFIPLAEETGMIVDIGEWVFNTAAQQVKLWRQQYHPQFQVSINKSPVQFRNERYDREHWPRQLRQFDLPGQSIVIEITEGLLLEAGSLINEQLLTFRNAGMQVALDDFGTGYSSLAYLKKFDIDYLKIDQAFVRHLSAESSDMALCEAIIVMAHKLGIKVVAEGIETAEQFDLLINAGCDFGQGYLFSRPVPADEFDALLSQLDTL